jgi:hypothetical protein
MLGQSQPQSSQASKAAGEGLDLTFFLIKVGTKPGRKNRDLSFYEPD